MPRIYTMLGIVPTVATPDHTTETLTMTRAERVSAINGMARLPGQVWTHSAGMADVHMTILILTTPIIGTDYGLISRQTYVSPEKLADRLGEKLRYDYICVYTPRRFVTATTFRAIATYSGYWCVTSDPDSDVMGVHELHHVLETHLRPRGYLNWPQCGEADGQSVHCNEAYGFLTDTEIGWYNGIFQGTLPDGTGINQTGWNIQTPTELGARTVLAERRGRKSPYMRMPRVIPEAV